jgi:hypothetical protein
LRENLAFGASLTSVRAAAPIAQPFLRIAITYNKS